MIDVLQGKIEAIIGQFLDEEKHLLIRDGSEQAIAASFMAKLKPNFEGWNVDCEYNRNMESIKRLNYAIYNDGEVDEHRVQPDIIIHKRGTPENLLVIEIKKTTNKEDDIKDLRKLRAFREQLDYRAALFLRFIAGEKETGIEKLEWV